MTDREKAIVMAYTGKCMLTGNKFQIFHKYVEDIMGKPIMTHEMAFLADAIKENSKADFLALCADESNSENPSEWIPVSERLPEKSVWVLAYCKTKDGYEYQTVLLIGKYRGEWTDNDDFCDEVIAWRPLPEPYRESEAAE